jgi:transcriptional regulator with XRE-family HTH domain
VIGRENPSGHGDLPPVPEPSDTPRAIFAANVTRLREERGLTQEKLGWAAGLHQTEVARIEKGTRNPGFDTIIKVAGGLGVPPAELFKGIG